MRGVPLPSLPQSILALRIITAGLILAHSFGRIIRGTIPQFGAAMEHLGLPAGVALVWAITLMEIAGAALIISGRRLRVGAALIASVLLAGLPLVHWRNGWYVGEFGTGGMEYTVALLAALFVIACSDTRGAALQR
jgi:putative oxidoreductase